MELSENGVRVSDITRLYVGDKHNISLLRRAIQADHLPESWRGYFQKELAKLTASSE